MEAGNVHKALSTVQAPRKCTINVNFLLFLILKTNSLLDTERDEQSLGKDEQRPFSITKI